MDRVSPTRTLSRPSFAVKDRTRLRFTFEASSLSQAVKLATELRRLTSELARVHPSLLRLSERRGWVVALTTPPTPLGLEVVQLWEEELLAVARRWPGCYLRGWMTCWPPRASVGSTDWTSDLEGARQSQRELVIASLLHCPPIERRAIVHGRGVPR
jgi:hypothetical protein